MTLAQIIKEIELNFPLSSQESYDNSGLLYGDPSLMVDNVLICLDVTDKVVEEAIRKKCQLIISHHPLIFHNIKKISASQAEHKSLIKCIQHNIALYALHTNLDNSKQGVNKKIGEKLTIDQPQILNGSLNMLKKLIVYIPNQSEYISKVDQAIFQNGGGKIGNYDECHFRAEGIGTFRPIAGAQPTLGKLDHRESVKEVKIEYLISSHQLEACLHAMLIAHPYEEVAHEIIPIENRHPSEGSGMIGSFNSQKSMGEVLEMIKSTFKCKMLRHTSNDLDAPISKIAWCGGSGAFLIESAKRKGAQVFLTSDVKYHEFFQSDVNFNIIDIGHFESEQFTIELIADFLKEKFTKFAIHLTEINTNPINYI